MKEKIVAITIPIYKEQIDENELISLSQIIKILSAYPIIFFAPQSLNTKFYENFCEGKINYSIERFENIYFKNIDGYNQLMLSAHFYKRFLNYKFILIYQLDAFVFKDELVYWCNQHYDFIGAPHSPEKNLPGDIQFLKNYSLFLKYINIFFKIKHRVSNVGNGGLSLRRTRSFYFLTRILKHWVEKWGKYNEDAFFKYWGNLFYPFFRLPSDEIALKFSIETNPKESLEKLNYTLPFGCHAFKKYDWETWKPFIVKDINI